MDPSLDFQKAVRSQLVATSAVTALVPATAIFDRNARPEVFPCVLIGEGQVLAPLGMARERHELYFDVHLWTNETGLVAVKQIAGAIREALADMSRLLDNHRLADFYIQQSRFMRDPDGVHSHGVMTLYAQLLEMAA